MIRHSDNLNSCGSQVFLKPILFSNAFLPYGGVAHLFLAENSAFAIVLSLLVFFFFEYKCPNIFSITVR